MAKATHDSERNGKYHTNQSGARTSISIYNTVPWEMNAVIDYFSLWHTIYTIVFLLGILDMRWERDTVLEQDRYGLMIYSVLDQKLIFSTVVTMAGVNTTVHIMKMFPSVAPAVTMVMYRMILNIFPLHA